MNVIDALRKVYYRSKVSVIVQVKQFEYQTTFAFFLENVLLLVPCRPLNMGSNLACGFYLTVFL